MFLSDLTRSKICCRVAVLDGGYPAWQAAGFEIDAAVLEEEEINAAAKSAQNPPADTTYKAHLQARSPLVLGQSTISWLPF